jgi:membrane protease YdiL (CAAX protease family)
MEIKRLNYFVLIIIYFALSWFYPWEPIEAYPALSKAYIFDFVFVVITTFVYRNWPQFLFEKIRAFFIKLGATLVLATGSILIIKFMQWKTPFEYMDRVFLQLVILAPILEELVFRNVFYQLSNRYFKQKKWPVYFNAAIFSLSHFPAFWYLPAEFHPFIYWQLFYTFFLGLICARAMQDQKSILGPIILHLIFNFMFYSLVT